MNSCRGIKNFAGLY